MRDRLADIALIVCPVLMFVAALWLLRWVLGGA